MTINVLTVLLALLLLAGLLIGFLVFRQYKLRQRLKKRSEELSSAREEAKKADRAKNEFLARMSHDIRTPLNAIMGMADLLQKTSLNREQEEYVQNCRRASETLLHLINDILDLSRVEFGELQLEQDRIDLEPMIMDIVSYFARKAQDKGLELPVYIDPDCPPVIGDQNRLQQILINLISNALKFTPSGEVVVRAMPNKSSREPDITRFEVEDTGIGIPEEKQQQIFDRFTQANSDLSDKYEGTGLGLSICKHLVERMGGEIGVESEEGKGSLFWFELPLDVVDEASERTMEEREEDDPRSHQKPLTDTRVLVVDDVETNRTIFTKILNDLGASVTEAKDGYEALEHVHRGGEQGESFDLLLIDRHMPEMDGFELGQELQETFSLDRVAIMLTSSNMSTDREKAKQLGFGDYIIKPVSQSVLLASIRRLRGENDHDAGDGKADMEVPDWQSLDRPPRILIAEDNRHNQKLMEAILKQYPVRMDFAENGSKALKMAKSGLFDLILMDVHMPEMSGLEATSKFREWEQDNDVRHTPVIALTAQSLDRDRKESLDAGCDEHVTKPVRENVLVHTIRKYMADAADRPSPSPDHAPSEEGVQEKKPREPVPSSEHQEETPSAISVEVDRRFEEFVPEFLEDVQKKCALMNELVDRNKPEEISDIVHDLKGAAGTFGFSRMQKFAEDIEAALRKDRTDRIADLLADLEHRLQHLTVRYV